MFGRKFLEDYFKFEDRNATYSDQCPLGLVSMIPSSPFHQYYYLPDRHPSPHSLLTLQLVHPLQLIGLPHTFMTEKTNEFN